MCEETYTGQTVTLFAKRWNSHRSTWNKNIKNKTNKILKSGKYKESDENALYQHYLFKHPEKLLEIQDQLAKAYKIILIEKPPKNKVDNAENYWIYKLKSKINIMKSQAAQYDWEQCTLDVVQPAKKSTLILSRLC